ncbi:hypothetical protein B296_00044089 [Ensete ventricosum]|uniref:Uncharacterized protein n=1 Tax=Ensete ventricosum TaxID=4639 RepID=A0A426Y879_ENSVE|nr:hypothetical protein B296_00044089 [Ensete ventricosum]
MGEVKEGLNQKDGGRGLAIGGGSPGSLNNLQYQFGVSMGRLVFGSAGSSLQRVIRPLTLSCCQVDIRRGDSPYRGRLMWFQEMTCGRLVGLAH